MNFFYLEFTHHAYISGVWPEAHLRKKKKVLKAMFTLSGRIAVLMAQKPYRMELLFTHKNSDFGAISVTE